MPSRTKEQLEKIWIKKTMSHIGSGKDNLSKRTLSLYAERIKRVWKLLYPDKSFKGKTFIHRDVKKIIKAINEDEMAISSKAGLYSALLSTYNSKSVKILANGKSMYARELKKWSDIIKNSDKKQVNNKKENIRWKTSEELKEGREKLWNKYLSSKKLKDYRDYVMFSLFTLLPPRRSLDYSEMIVSQDENKEGNLLITRFKKNKDGSKRKRVFWKFIFNDFKLSKNKGSESFDRYFILNLPNGKEIINLLDDWIRKNPKKYFLLEPRNGTHMSKAMSRLSTKAVGQPVNINILRHIYISEFLDTNPFLLEKEAVSLFMSHSIAQQEMYRKRINKEDIKGFEREEPELEAVPET